MSRILFKDTYEKHTRTCKHRVNKHKNYKFIRHFSNFYRIHTHTNTLTLNLTTVCFFSLLEHLSQRHVIIPIKRRLMFNICTTEPHLWWCLVLFCGTNIKLKFLHIKYYNNLILMEILDQIQLIQMQLYFSWDV